MALSGEFSMTISALGVTITGSASREGDLGIEAVTTILPVGWAGVLTRSDADTGVITLGAGHSVINGKVDVHWEGGCRYNMDGTVTDTNTLTVDGGAGDDLPATAVTPVVSQNPSILDLTFDGDNLSLIGVGASRQTQVCFMASTAVLKSVFLIDNAAWGWADAMGGSNPLTGSAVTSVKASNGSSTLTNTVKITGLQYEV
jgi:hypothetical protein